MAAKLFWDTNFDEDFESAREGACGQGRGDKLSRMLGILMKRPTQTREILSIK
jgi:hypothetical protein